MPNATMTLPSRTAVALWVNELSGQISDGMWENSRPYDHWKFWCRLDVRFGEVASFNRGGEWVGKYNYNFANLYKYVGDRMLAIGRMAKAGADPNDRSIRCIAEYMPTTFEEFKRNQETSDWKYQFIHDEMKNVTDELASAFYASSYTMKEMKADIALIKDTMKMVSNQQ
jgi:hypothetical protein